MNDDHLRTVGLHEITAATVRRICELTPCAGQEQFVAPVAVSIAQAHFTPTAWFRAIYADEEPVGFVMLRKEPDKRTCFIWRLVIDCGHQGRGYGRAAVVHCIHEIRQWPGFVSLVTSCADGPGSPRGFYLKLGFTQTGEIGPSGEAILRMDLA
jgi:diamine N-acetyltransferase